MKKYIPISEMLWFQEGPGVRNTQYTTSGVKLLNVANLINGELDITNTERYISEDEAYGRYKHFLVDEGDFIIASSGIKVEYFDKKMGFAKKEQLPLCMNTSTIRFKVLDKEQLSIRYFMYYLKSNHFKRQLNYQITGSAQLNFGPSHLKRMLFPIVGMEEQKQITEKMDALYAIEASLKKELNLFDELVKSRFIELFGDDKYESMRLGDVCIKITDGTHKTPQYLNKGITFISAKNIVNGELDFSDIKYISENEYMDIQKRCQTEINDILLSKSGSLGVPVIVRTEERLGLFESLAIIKYDRRKLIPEFLCEQLKTEKIQRQFRTGIKGVAIKHLHLGVIADIKIIVPNLEEQLKFADFVKHVDKSKYYNFTSYKYCVLAANLIRQEWMLCQTLSF